MPRVPALTLPTAALVLALDQATKAMVADWAPGATRVIAPGLARLVHLRNPDGALGLLSDLPLDLRLLAFGLATGGLFGAGLSFARRAGPDPWIGLGLGLVLGGAFGNTVDRATRGAVIDLLVLGEALWPLPAGLSALNLPGPPAFNLADAAIAAGVLTLTLAVLSRIARRRGPTVAPTAPAR